MVIQILLVHRDVSKRYLMMMTYFSLGKSGPNTVFYCCIDFYWFCINLQLFCQHS